MYPKLVSQVIVMTMVKTMVRVLVVMTNDDGDNNSKFDDDDAGNGDGKDPPDNFSFLERNMAGLFAFSIPGLTK